MPDMVAMSAMHKQVQQRTEQQQDIGQCAEDMGSVFGNQVESGDHEKDEENLS